MRNHYWPLINGIRAHVGLIIAAVTFFAALEPWLKVSQLARFLVARWQNAIDNFWTAIGNLVGVRLDNGSKMAASVFVLVFLISYPYRKQRAHEKTKIAKFASYALGFLFFTGFTLLLLAALNVRNPPTSPHNLTSALVIAAIFAAGLVVQRLIAGPTWNIPYYLDDLLLMVVVVAVLIGLNGLAVISNDFEVVRITLERLFD